MPRIPTLTAADIERALARLGFTFERQKGSHRIYKHPDKGIAVLPFHKGKDVAPILVRELLRQTGISVSELLAVLKE